MDTDTREVWRGDRAIELTATEWRLLHYLVANQRRVLTRSQILDHVWEYDFAGDAGVLETYISYLRKKVDAGEDVALIQTVRGVGYSLRPPRESPVTLRTRLIATVVAPRGGGADARRRWPPTGRSRATWATGPS